jgi:hypothetical protein
MAFKVFISVGREIGESKGRVNKYVAWSLEIPILRKHGSGEDPCSTTGLNLRQNYIYTPKMEAAATSQTLIPFYNCTTLQHGRAFY